MKIVAISDQHGTLPDIPPCDLLLIGGDNCPITNHDPVFQAHWLATDYRAWLENLPARKIIGIAGNHDLVYERMPELVPRDLPWTYLEEAATEWEGIKVYGTPWQPWFFDWAFNGTPEILYRKWAQIPDDTDILLVHGPPRGFGDGVPEGGGIRSCGCPHLRERILQLPKCRLVVYGHIHEGRGVYELGGKVLANVAILDGGYHHVYEPWVYEWNEE